LIATVLLVLIVIAAVGIIWTAVSRMIKIPISATECPKFDLSVNTDEGYSWYDSSVTMPSTTLKNVQVMITAGGNVVKADLRNLQIKIRYGGKSEMFYVTDALATDGVMRTDITTMPGPNEDLVYKLNTTSTIAAGTPVSASVAAVIKPAAGEKITTCKMSDPIDLPEVSEIST